LICEYLREFSKKFETVQIGYSGAEGKLIDEKTRSKKSRDTVPLTLLYTHGLGIVVLQKIYCKIELK
jgi:hypothetical protein